MNTASPRIKPRLCLTVGVTGHRLHRLGGANLAALRNVVGTTLRQLHKAIDSVAHEHAPVFAKAAAQPRMISALADGADTIVTQAALTAGWRVDACLPFPRDIYAADFEAGVPREEYSALLKDMTAVFELPGGHADEDTRNAAYESVGRLVLEQSDILLALWDGDVGRGRGGTSRVVAEAVARHIPVIHIHTLGAAPPQLLWTGLSDAEIEQPSVEIVPRAPAEASIVQVVTALAAPPQDKIDQRMLAAFYKEQSHHGTPALPYPMLLAMTGVRSLSRGDFRPQQAEDSGASLSGLLQHAARLDAFMPSLISRYGVADAAATYFAQIFRSGFVANFSLAALAVLLSLSGPLVPGLKLPLIATELLIVVLILLNTHAGNKFGWHERWMDNRHLAEQLRSLALTSLLGELSLRAHSGRDAAAIPGWVGWLARATAREVAIPQVNADAAYLAGVRDTAMRLIDDQIAYQRSNTARMHKLEHRLHHAGEFLFGGTIVACVGWIAFKVTGLPMTGVGPIGVTEIVSLLTASMPALGAAIYGIRMQGDFAGVAYRSQVTVERLERLKRAMQKDPVDYTRLSARLRNLADIMLTDVSSWRTTYQARPLALPG